MRRNLDPHQPAPRFLYTDEVFRCGRPMSFTQRSFGSYRCAFKATSHLDLYSFLASCSRPTVAISLERERLLEKREPVFASGKHPALRKSLRNTSDE